MRRRERDFDLTDAQWAEVERLRIVLSPDSSLQEKLAVVLGIDAAKAVVLAEVLEEEIDERAERKASDALDREFNRGDWRS